MAETWEILNTWCKEYFSGSGYMLLLGVCLLLLMLREPKGKIRSALLFPTLLLLAVVLCPLTADILMKMIGGEVYWRCFWMLPIVLLGAYVATEAVARSRGRIKRLLTAVMCVALIAFNGTFVFSNAYFSTRENNYKLPTEVIWVADAINRHAAKNGIKKKKIVAPTGIATYIRIYDASILQRYGRSMANSEWKSELYLEVNSDTPDFEHLAERARIAKCRYVVLMAKVDDEEAMKAVKYKKIYESPSYAVYFDRRYRKRKTKGTQNRTAVGTAGI